MEKYYRERFQFQEKLIRKTSPCTDVGQIIEKARAELKSALADAVEVCILLLDPEAENYTRPIQCALHKRTFQCQACKPDRPAVRKAVNRKKGVVFPRSAPIVRLSRNPVCIGPEYAVPILINHEVLGVVSVVTRPESLYRSKDFFLIRDVARLLSGIVLNARRQWQMSLEKIRISRAFSNLTPFVPTTVRTIAEQNPEMLDMKKQTKAVTVLFLDLEGYTCLSAVRPAVEVNELVERIFSSFVDPIHRYQGTINETAGDGLMIIFEGNDPAANAKNAVKTSFEIADRTRTMSGPLGSKAPIHVNIGINSGNALVGMSKFKGILNTRMTYTASGPVTNIAARLSDWATGGDILIGEDTKNTIQGLWPVFDRGKILLKGMIQPLQVYSLLKKDKIENQLSG